MAARMKVGHFEPDGGLIYLPIGFVPDLFWLIELGVTAPTQYIWFERMEDDEASNSQEGIKINGADGVTSKLADAGGITAYNTGTQLPTITTWTQAVGNAATARSATAHGTYVRPTTSGTDADGAGADREAIFECVTDGTSAATEPAWPVETGGQVTDGTTVWEKVNVPLVRGGYQGVCIAAALMTNSQEMYFAAFQEDGASEDYGDVDGWTGGIRGA